MAARGLHGAAQLDGLPAALGLQQDGAAAVDAVADRQRAVAGPQDDAARVVRGRFVARAQGGHPQIAVHRLQRDRAVEGADEGGEESSRQVDQVDGPGAAHLRQRQGRRVDFHHTQGAEAAAGLEGQRACDHLGGAVAGHRGFDRSGRRDDGHRAGPGVQAAQHDVQGRLIMD